MKEILMILIISIAASTVTSGQTKTLTNTSNSAEAQIIALEKAGWEAWKNKDAVWYQNNLTADFLLVNSEGISSKAEVIRVTPTDCVVKSFALDNFKFVQLNKDAVLLTYTAKQDAICNGKTIPVNVRSSVNYVKRAGKWLEAFYMETPMSQ